jgi:hypothetical protein
VIGEDQPVTLTSRRWALERGEVVTTALAFAISTTLYLRHGHAYLAQGVLGDLAGFGLLTAVLAVRRRRLRHEALVCLAAILAVLAAEPRWPLRWRSATWWTLVAAGLTAYLLVRRRLLHAATDAREERR